MQGFLEIKRIGLSNLRSWLQQFREFLGFLFGSG